MLVQSLAAMLHAGPVEVEGADGWRRIVALAGQHLVTPALWPALRDRSATMRIEPDLAAYLEAVHGLNLHRNARLLTQAAELADALNDVGVEPVFLKGMAILLLGLATDPGARLIGDIDVLIPLDRFDAAADALRAHGYRDLAAPRPEAHDRARLLRSDRPAWVELHQFPVPYHLEGLVPSGAVLSQSRLVDALAPARARTPCPEHLVVHNFVHSMLHHRGFRLSEVSLRDALDLALLARSFGEEIDWNRIALGMDAEPGGGDALEFYICACRSLLPRAGLPDLPSGAPARAALRRWRRRRGGHASRLAHLSLRSREFAQDLSWRLRNVPDQRRRLLTIILTPRRYPERARHLIDAIRYGFVPLQERRSSGASPEVRSERM